MNMELPDLTTITAVLDLIALGLVNGFALVLHTWWGVPVLIVLAVITVCGYAPSLGFAEYDDPSPWEETGREYTCRVASHRHH